MTYTPTIPPQASSPPELGQVELDIDGPNTQNRATVAFRILMLVPHYVVMTACAAAAMVVTFLGWFAALATGQLPEWAQRFLTGYLGYITRVNAYLYLLVDHYPPFTFSAEDYPVRLEVPTGRLNRAAVLFRLVLMIPALFVSNFVATGWVLCAFVLWLTVLIAGRTPAPVFGATASVLRYATRLAAYAMLLTPRYPNPKSLWGDRVVNASQHGVPHGTRPMALTRGAVALIATFVLLGAAGAIGNNMAEQSMIQQQTTAVSQP